MSTTRPVSGSFLDKAGSWAINIIFFHRWTLWLWRQLGPRHILGTRWVFVTRRDDVMAVLGNHNAFEVRFEQVFGQIAGTNFLLGMNQSTEQQQQTYQRVRRQTMQAFTYGDAKTTVAVQALDHAERILSTKVSASPEFDAVGELITRVAVDLVQSYFGIDIYDNSDAAKSTFADQAIALNKAMFGDLKKPGNLRGTLLLKFLTWRSPVSSLLQLEQNGVAAGQALYTTIKDVIARRKADGQEAASTGTVLDRLLHRQAQPQPSAEDRLTDDDIASCLLGMIVGFVPTNTMAGAHILEMLLKRRDFMEAALAVHAAGDDDGLLRCLLEVMRFQPLKLLPQRTCVQQPYYTLAAGTWRAFKVYPDQLVLCSLESAMFDERHVRAPKRFDPDRSPADSLVFGYGIHNCIGVVIGEAHLMAVFKALLRRRFRAVSAMERDGLFPKHLRLAIADR